MRGKEGTRKTENSSNRLVDGSSSQEEIQRKKRYSNGQTRMATLDSQTCLRTEDQKNNKNVPNNLDFLLKFSLKSRVTTFLEVMGKVGQNGQN